MEVTGDIIKEYITQKNSDYQSIENQKAVITHYPPMKSLNLRPTSITDLSDIPLALSDELNMQNNNTPTSLMEKALLAIVNSTTYSTSCYDNYFLTKKDKKKEVIDKDDSVILINIDALATNLSDNEFKRVYPNGVNKDKRTDCYTEIYDKYYDLIYNNRHDEESIESGISLNAK